MLAGFLFKSAFSANREAEWGTALLACRPPSPCLERRRGHGRFGDGTRCVTTPGNPPFMHGLSSPMFCCAGRQWDACCGFGGWLTVPGRPGAGGGFRVQAGGAGAEPPQLVTLLAAPTSSPVHCPTMLSHRFVAHCPAPADPLQTAAPFSNSNAVNMTMSSVIFSLTGPPAPDNKMCAIIVWASCINVSPHACVVGLTWRRQHASSC